MKKIELASERYDKLPVIFLSLSLLIGIIFSILFPLYQVPDELTHINMMYSELNMDVDFYKETNGFGDTARIISKYNEKVDITNYFDFDKKLLIEDNYAIPKITIVKHFPQTIGMIFSEILHLPIIVSITIGELCAVIFYSLVCSRALKIMPIKKEIMMMIMLLPICIQQMASFSYDAILLPICFYFIAYILYLKFTKEVINLKDLLVIFILLILIAILKIPYILLGLLIFILPIKKISIYKLNYSFINKHKIKMIIIFSIILLFILPIGIKLLNNISYGRILLAAIMSPVNSLKLILNTINTYKFGYLKQLTGEFGWFDTPTSIWYTVYILMSLLIISFANFKKDEKEVIKISFTKKETIYLYIIGIIMVILIILSMFEWTLYIKGYTNTNNLSINQLKDLFTSISLIEGVQGRYFIPIIPLFLIPIYSEKFPIKLKQFNISLFLVFYYLVLIIYMIIIVLYRYWI